ncbi:(+)-neomenthol dehydrogenase-like protein [Drosera capensis]
MWEQQNWEQHQGFEDRGETFRDFVHDGRTYVVAVNTCGLSPYTSRSAVFVVPFRYAVVTGGNKGIGLEVCRQLAAHGVTVVLTARDTKKGLEAIGNLSKSGFSDRVHFHQLDVLDPHCITNLADFVKSEFGKIDILGEGPSLLQVNNAGIGGVVFDVDACKARCAAAAEGESSVSVFDGTTTSTYELSKVCMDTNFYGTKLVTEALLPLLQLSDSPRIVNVSSCEGKMKLISDEWAKGILSNIEDLTEEKIDEVITAFLQDFKEGKLAENGWRTFLPAYSVSKIALNAYTRLMAKRYPLMSINSVHPGFIKTDLTIFIGNSTPEGGGSSVAITPEMMEFMQKLRKVVTVGVVGGYDLVKISEQLNEGITKNLKPPFLIRLRKDDPNVLAIPTKNLLQKLAF